MAYRKYLLMWCLCMAGMAVRAQTIGFQEADSVSLIQYQAGSWSQLIGYGKQAIISGADFPLLRLRMAYAQFALGNYSAALIQYKQVLADDSHNFTARYYSYLCNLYLNRNAAAYYQISYMGAASIQQENLNPYGLIQAGLESSVKFPGYTLRGNGVYTRVSLANRLGWKMQLDQSVAYFGQTINFRVPGNGPMGSPAFTVNNTVHQLEYYGKLNYTFAGHLSAWGGYHYLNTSYAQSTFNNHIGLLGIKYTHPYFDVQADANMGSITDVTVRQYNLQINLFPLGNLKLYTTTRGSLLYQESVSNGVFSQLVGFKTTRKTWLELAATWGTQNNYLEADGLYVYNALDITKFKAGTTGFYQLNSHAQLYINYLYEKKKDFYQGNNYNQHSITGGITWKF